MNKIIDGKNYNEVDAMFPDGFLVTGILYHGSMFRQTHKSCKQAFHINLWNGRVWGLKDGKRTLLKTVIN